MLAFIPQQHQQILALCIYFVYWREFREKWVWEWAQSHHIKELKYQINFQKIL